MANMIWPTVGPCLIVALLQGGPDATQHAYRPLSMNAGQCGVLVGYVRQESFFIEKGERRIEIPLPETPGWTRLDYRWGVDTAYLDGQPVLVRMGPAASY